MQFEEVKVKVSQSCLTLCDPMDCPWNSPGQNTGVGSFSFLQGIFPTQGLNQVSCIAGGFFTSRATREAHTHTHIDFLPRSKHLLISWLQLLSQQFWSPRKYSLSLFPVFPHQYMQSLCVWVWVIPLLGNILVEILWGAGLKYIPPKTICPGTRWYYIYGTT